MFNRVIARPFLLSKTTTLPGNFKTYPWKIKPLITPGLLKESYSTELILKFLWHTKYIVKTSIQHEFCPSIRNLDQTWTVITICNTVVSKYTCFTHALNNVRKKIGQPAYSKKGIKEHSFHINTLYNRLPCMQDYLIGPRSMLMLFVSSWFVSYCVSFHWLPKNLHNPIKLSLKMRFHILQWKCMLTFWE